MSEESSPGVTSGRKAVTIALMMAMAVAALEQTVVSPAMPTIIASLRGFRIYPWVFSAYLLAATVTVPLYGKLADLLGRKRVLMFGLVLFGIGSILSGLSQSMGMLIGMRVIQGLGAGAVAPIVLTMIGDLFTLEERARIQGLFSGVWGLSSLAGPALGGVLTERLSWRWVFLVTVPFNVLACWILARKVRESVADHAVPPIDWPGAMLLAGGATLLLLSVLGAEGRSWPSQAALIAGSAFLLALFVRQERRAADPVLPLDLVSRPAIAVAIVGSFLLGVQLFGIDTYVPLYVQGVRGGSAEQAGWAITPLFLTWSISVALAAKVVVRMGFRATALVGATFIAAGTAGLAIGASWPSRSGPIFAVSMVVIGLGMGPAALSYLLSVQHVVPWNRRGVATGAVAFFRTTGGALGVGLLGALLGYEVAARLIHLPGLDPTAALRPETHALLTPRQLLAVQSALGRGLRDVFLQMLALGLLAVGCSWWLPSGRIGQDAAQEGGGDAGQVPVELSLEM
jgi:EmrB/QacA subfamily drug resistance transporter